MKIAMLLVVRIKRFEPPAFFGNGSTYRNI